MNFLDDQVNTQLYYIENGINNQYKKIGLGNKPNSRIKMMKRGEARNLDKEIKMACL